MGTEIWRPVKGYEGLYEVSSLGYVKSLNYHRTGKEKILKPAKNKYGYLFVALYRNGKRKMSKLHRLVAEAFIPNPEGFKQVNHIDEDKTNNVVSNLEFCDCKYNNNFGTRNERSAVSQRNHPAKSKPVEASKYPDFRTIEFCFASTMEAGRNGYTFQSVSACCRGSFNREGNNKYKNLYWRYADESKNVIMQERQILIFMNVINNFKQKCLI